jgi:hypothetical protein
MCARFQVAHKECHLRAVKRIMTYLVLIPNLVLWYPKGSHFDLIGYSNADYAGCRVDRNSNVIVVLEVLFLYTTMQVRVCVDRDNQILWVLRNKIMLPYPWPKKSMLWSLVVVHNYFGCGKL